MASRRDILVDAAGKATLLHRRFIQQDRPGFDVLAAATALDIPVMFQKQPMLGASILQDDQYGVIVTTERPLSVQRFTLAHELGHIQLGHENQFDFEEGQFRLDDDGAKHIDEMAADVFASQLLAPLNRVRTVASRFGWGPVELRSPARIYQLGLRFGISFYAMTMALREHRFLPRSYADELSSKRNKLLPEIKKIASNDQLEDRRNDAWILGPLDDNLVFEGNPGDTFQFTAPQRSSAGYIWELTDDPALNVLSDTTTHAEVVGSPIERSILFTTTEHGQHAIKLVEHRPWQDKQAAKVDVGMAATGIHDAGLSPNWRQRILDEGA